MSSVTHKTKLLGAALLLASCAAELPADEPSADEIGLDASAVSASLGSFNVDKTKTSVSGLSSGGFMADQFHVAYSASLIGAAIHGRRTVLLRPRQLRHLRHPVRTGHRRTQRLPVARHRTKPRLAGQDRPALQPRLTQGLLLHQHRRQRDQGRGGQRRPRLLLASRGPCRQLKMVNNLNSGHGMITDDFGGSCSSTASPYINDCNYDQAGTSSSTSTARSTPSALRADRSSPLTKQSSSQPHRSLHERDGLCLRPERVRGGSDL